jgi:hypothetical protein
MFFNFFKQPQVRQFEHIPIYWDPDKEAMQERRERARQQIANERGDKSVPPRSTLHRGFLTEQRKSKNIDRQSRTTRLALIIAVGVILVIWMMSN